jgi:hypothetical protein
MGVIGKGGLLATLAAWPLFAQSPTALDSAVAGCYALSWVGDSGAFRPAPDTVALTLLTATWPPGYFAVRADAGWEGRNGLNSTIHFYWGHRSADTVLVVTGNGFSGITLTLVRTATGLRGIARAFSDQLSLAGTLPKWKVEARRTACLGFR